MTRWRRIQPVVLLLLGAFVVTRGIVSITEGRAGFGWFQVAGGALLAGVVIYESRVLEPRRRAREGQDRRRR